MQWEYAVEDAMICCDPGGVELDSITIVIFGIIRLPTQVILERS